MVKVTRRVLSFDVGIINLAYCILEINDDEKTFKIDGWGIIDLASSRNHCGFVKNTGEICNKIANHVLKVDDDNKYYYCKAHASKARLKVLPIDMKWWKIDPDDVEKCAMCNKHGALWSNLVEGQYCIAHQKKIITEKKYICCTKKCNKVIELGMYLERESLDEDGSPDGDTHLELEQGWCNEHFDDEYAAFIKKKTKKISQNSNKISLNVLGLSMFKKLDKMPELLTVDEVLIENQPTMINPTMKTVSSMLFSYFIMRGVHEKTRTGSTITSINFCSPANKITVGGKSVGKKLTNANGADKGVYKITKELGKVFCKALVRCVRIP
jgi:hypothetical protein